MKIEENSRFSLPHDKKVLKLKSVSFHPVQNKLAVAFRRDIYEYDCVTGTRITHFSTETEVTHLAHGYSHNVLCAALRNGSFYIWDLSNGQLESFHLPLRTHERRPVLTMQMSRSRPVLYYAKVKATSVFGLEIFSNQKVPYEFSHKKPISALTCHPNRSLLATASSDGIIKIWNTDTNQLQLQFEETSSLKNNPKKSAITSMQFFSSSVNVDNIPTSNPNANSTGRARSSSRAPLPQSSEMTLLTTATKDGRVQIWQIVPNAGLFKSLGVIHFDDHIWITNVYFHPFLPCLFALNCRGILRPISIAHIMSSFIQTKQISESSMVGLLPTFDMVQPFYASTQDANSLSNRSFQSFLIPLIEFVMDERTGNMAFFGKISTLASVTAATTTAATAYFSLYNVPDSKDPHTSLPLAQQYPTSLPHYCSNVVEYSSPIQQFVFPFQEIYFVDHTSQYPQCLLMSQSLSDGSSSTLKMVVKSSQEEWRRCIRLQFTQQGERCILFFEKSVTATSLSRQNEDQGKYTFVRIEIKTQQISAATKGMDGGFANQDQEFYILEETGRKISIYNANAPTLVASSSVDVPHKVSRLFTCPTSKSVLVYWDHLRALGLAGSPQEVSSSLQNGKLLHLKQNETILQVQWQPQQSATQRLIAMLTNQRAVIVQESTMQIVNSVECHVHGGAPIYSILWLHNVLFYNTNQSLFCLPTFSSLQQQWNRPICVATLDASNSVLCALLPDRLVYVSQASRLPQMNTRFVHLCEPLIWSILSLQETTKESQWNYLQQVTRNLDSTTVREDCLLALEKCGFVDLATELVSESQYTFSWEIRFRLAVSSLQLSYALDILKQQQPQSLEGNCWNELLITCVKWGQFHVAYACMQQMLQNQQSTGIEWKLFQLCCIAKQWQGVQWLSSNFSTNYALMNACQVILSKQGLTTTTPATSVEWEPLPWKRAPKREIYLSKGLSKNMQLTSSAGQQDTNSLAPLDLKDIHSWMGNPLLVAPQQQQNEKGSSSNAAMKMSPSATTNWEQVDFGKETFGKTNKQENDSDSDEDKKDDENIDPQERARREHQTKEEELDPTFSRFRKIKINMNQNFAEQTAAVPTLSLSLNNNSSPSLGGGSSTAAGRRRTVKVSGGDLPSLDLPSAVPIAHTTAPPPIPNLFNSSIQSSPSVATSPPSLPNKFEEAPVSARGAKEDEDEDEEQQKKRRPAMRKNDSDSDSSDDNDPFENRSKLFRKVKIAATSVIKETDSQSLNLASMSLGSLGGSSLNASSSNNLGGGATARRRRVGTMNSSALDMIPRVNSELTENSSSNSLNELSDASSPNNSGILEQPVATSTNLPPKPTIPSIVPPQPLIQQQQEQSSLQQQQSQDLDSYREPTVVPQKLPAELLKEAMSCMESANYKQANEVATAAVMGLIQDQTQILKKQNILLCVRYLVLIHILRTMKHLEVTSSDPDTQEYLALLALFAVSVPQILLKHRIVCCNMAVKRNMQTGNFGAAAKVLRILLPQTPPQFRPQVENSLTICEQQQANRNSSATIEQLIQRVEWGDSGSKLPFCWQTLQVISPYEEPYLECSYCEAMYKMQQQQPNGEFVAVQPRQTCLYCNYGEMELKGVILSRSQSNGNTLELDDFLK